MVVGGGGRRGVGMGVQHTLQAWLEELGKLGGSFLENLGI